DDRASFRAAGAYRSTARSTAALASADGAGAGARPPRRCGGASGALGRSGFGQASSNVGGDTSPDSEAGTGPRSASEGSLARPWLRSRSFRDDEENTRFRRGLTPGASSMGTGGGPRRSRVAVSSRRCVDDGGGGGAASSA